MFDLIVVGGGLSGGLIARALLRLKPALRLAIVESEPILGGNHTWCFFESDLTPPQRHLISDLIVCRWDRYEVRFPGYTRVIDTPYAAVSSARFHDVLTDEFASASIVQDRATNVTPNKVTLAGGEDLDAHCVIDARGIRSTPYLELGFQKFVALEFELASPHALRYPIIMDATVPQHDGYRFFYSLPLTPTRLLVYDTYYSDGESLAYEALDERIRAYSHDQGWSIARVQRSEHGVLPIILAGNEEQMLLEQTKAAPLVGLGAGLFHPTTGYSLPDAVRLAEALAETMQTRALTTANVRDVIVQQVKQVWRRRSFYRLLNRMLFKAAEPHRRYQVLERFYRLDTGLIQRFYAAQLTNPDRLRIMLGKPPVPVTRALSVLSETSVYKGTA